MLTNFLIIPVFIGKTKVKPAPVISTGAATALSEKKIQTPPLATLKTIKTSSM